MLLPAKLITVRSLLLWQTLLSRFIAKLHRTEEAFDRELILGRFFVCFACVREGVRNEAVDSIDAYLEGLSHMKKKSSF